ncbi:hypothetical protein ATANTOWER_010074, partial [Ataeniobius toweri]|nr:hypothetical protein [Ataeniobius toweri]
MVKDSAGPWRLCKQCCCWAFSSTPAGVPTKVSKRACTTSRHITMAGRTFERTCLTMTRKEEGRRT